ncbi:MAG TPA: nicotinic acid mononucleotide adenylyltransferase, partial [Chitinophaga sp.]|uniref:nicotinate-nicotinamide nucleotide adenylyltransferase n=1 Tax=Chitinophaga sp. TaxID=1869181 RepID=UPI002DC21A4E|nr:nicotinic acid mononucleotide adenylyltransferase [Chitinophaga sp.]
LTYLSEKFPTQEFTVIMGSDSFQNIRRWKNYEQLIKHYPIYVYKRPGHEVTETYGARVEVLEAPLLDISATDIRRWIQERKSIRYLVPDSVLEYIEANNYYR